MSSMTGGEVVRCIKMSKRNTTLLIRERWWVKSFFLVKDSLSSLNWEMESETRMIGGYNCFKATAVIPVNPTDFRNLKIKRWRR
jgi:GLPGLI family protein